VELADELQVTFILANRQVIFEWSLRADDLINVGIDHQRLTHQL
jgi:hypothetical protein